MVLGMLSWILIGAGVGLVAGRLLPGHPQLGWRLAGGVGLLAGVAGGVLATALGFGGLASLDLRAAITAGLSALLALFVLRLVTLAPPPGADCYHTDPPGSQTVRRREEQRR